MNATQIISTIVALLAGDPVDKSFPIIAKGGAEAAFPVRVEACPRPLPPMEVEGKTVVCGRVTVPENHAKPDGKKIDLAFAVLKARTLSPAPDPLIYLHGGPGGGAVSDLAGIVVPLWDSYRSRRDVVTFDQRAAGISSDMVTCFQTAGVKIVDLFNPAKLGTEGILKMMPECLNEVKASGRDLTSYNTVQNAKDVSALMHTLGYQQYNIYGVSYGTKLSLEVMRSAPEGVRSVVIDSVFPPNSRGYDTNIIPVQEGVQKVVDGCAADAACNAAFPDLATTINRAAQKLEKNPIPAARGRPEVNVDTMISLFESRNTFGYWPNTTGHIPLIVSEWDRGETKTWDLLSSGAATPPGTTASVIQPHQGKLTQEQKSMATSLLDLAQNMFANERALDSLTQALSDSLARTSTGATDLAARFDKAVTQSIIGTRSREKMISFARDYAALATANADRTLLRDLVIKHLPPADVESTLAVLDIMSEADVKATFSAVAKEAHGIYKPLVSVLDLLVFACQEDLPFNSMEGAEKVNAELKFPFLTRSEYAKDYKMFQACNYLPPFAKEGYHDAVVSDIPTLVFYGWLDTQTSTEEAELAASSLKNARIYGFPEAGHAALVFSQCAKDIGSAFVERPSDPLETGCIESLKPKWILPPKG